MLYYKFEKQFLEAKNLYSVELSPLPPPSICYIELIIVLLQRDIQCLFKNKLSQLNIYCKCNNDLSDMHTSDIHLCLIWNIQI